MGTLSDTHRRALRCALGFEVGATTDRLVVSNAALLWLRAVAAETPLVIVIDDLHWVDRASAEVLGFVARRLAGSPIMFLAACRPDQGGFFQGSGLAEVVLPPLPCSAARTLLDQRFPDLAPAVRHRLLTEAAGNPLALLELPSALDGDQRADFTALPDALPLPDRLRAPFTARVRALPRRCRLMMLLGVVGGTIDVARLRTAGGDTCDLGDLAPATAGSLAQLTATRLSFPHPLIASAVVEACPERDRRWAHGRLAAIADTPERRARHLAGSAAGADAGIAAELATSAQALLRHGDVLGAVAALTRAADLSPDPADRSRRLAEAACLAADDGGELSTATRLLGDARRSGALDSHSLPGAAAAAHLLLHSDGDVTTAHRVLAGAIEAGDHGFDAGDPMLVDALLNLMLISWYAGTEQAWQTWHALAGKLTPQPPPVLQVNATVFADPARASAADVTALDTLIDAAVTDDDPARLVRTGTAAVFADRLHLLRGPERRLVRTRQAGRRLDALLHLGIDSYHAGRWDESWQLADEGSAVCAEHGLRFYHWYFDWVRALVAAGRGEVATARGLTDELARWASVHQAAGIAHCAAQARALTEIGAGDHDAAYRHAALVSPPGELAAYRPAALWTALDLVEAGVYSGRRAEAAAHAGALRDARLGLLSPRLGLVTAAASAITADELTFRERFEAALSGPGLDCWPFDLARVRLAYGERLRRLRSTSAAREQLVMAHDAFATLGAAPWRDRAAAELRATGLTRRSASETTAPLTPQEHEIAVLAGAGLTNKQIGQKLFISHRTVGDHLYKIFPKLGIASRAALGGALTAHDERTGWTRTSCDGCCAHGAAPVRTRTAG